jgi:hypothetical protein
MKTIVTHIGPDLDACASVWLIKTFLPEWEEANIAFVPAGTTLEGMAPDSDEDVMHVDTGFGAFDHHQTDEDTCAALRVYEYLRDQRFIQLKDREPLERLLHVVNDIDHFREVFFPNPTADFWDISLPAVIDGWRVLFSDNQMKLVDMVMTNLDGAYKMFQNKVWAEKEIQEKAIIFETRWGKAFGIETLNDETVHYGQKMGYALVMRKDPKKGYLRIKAIPRPEIDLTNIYDELQRNDPNATWFLHASKHMILNGSAKNPDMRPTTLSLEKIVEIIKGMTMRN